MILLDNKATTNNQSPVYDSVDELASEIKLSRVNTYKALKEGTIPSRRIGKRFIISRQAIQKWLETSGATQTAA